MQEVFLAECFTGAHCASAYTTLQLAQAALQAHYLRIGGEGELCFTLVHRGYWVANSNSIMEEVRIVSYQLNTPLPIV